MQIDIHTKKKSENISSHFLGVHFSFSSSTLSRLDAINERQYTLLLGTSLVTKRTRDTHKHTNTQTRGQEKHLSYKTLEREREEEKEKREKGALNRES